MVHKESCHYWFIWYSGSFGVCDLIWPLQKIILPRTTGFLKIVQLFGTGNRAHNSQRYITPTPTMGNPDCTKNKLFQRHFYVNNCYLYHQLTLYRLLRVSVTIAIVLFVSMEQVHCNMSNHLEIETQESVLTWVLLLMLNVWMQQLLLPIVVI